MNWVRSNPYTSLFGSGFCLFCGGIAAWSVEAAAICGGAVLMTLAVWPVVSRKS